MNATRLPSDAERIRSLFIIRIALLAGVVLFAGVTHWLHMQGRLPMPDEAGLRMLDTLRYVLWGVCAFAVAWAFIWKARAESAKDMAGVSTALIIAWAPGEAAGLLGCVIHFQGGPIAPMATGILAFVVVLLVARIPRLPT